MKRRKHDGNGYMRSMEKCSPGDMVDDHGMNVMVETQANHSTDSNEVSVRNDDPQTIDRDEEDEGNLSDVSGVLESSPSPQPRPQSSTPRTSSVSESEPEPETEPEPTSKSKSKTNTKSTDSRVVPSAPITTSAHHHDDGLNGNPLKQSATLSSARCTKISLPNDERDGDEILPEDILESRFTLQNKVYAGTYGEVWRATDNINGQTRALKFIKISHRTSRSGFPNTALREIDLLHRCRGQPHCNIIRMHGVVCSSKNLKKMAMVLEFAEHDLKTLLDLGIVYSQSEVKCLLKQLLSGLSYLHRRYIMHRDLKPNNLLLRSDGTLKICDFGQSRRFAEPLKGCMYSPQCTTLYYRAPEMLLDVREYGGSVDNWAVGCIAVELFLKKPVFKIDGRNQGPLDGETALLNMMISVLGSPFTVGGNEWSAFEGLFRKCQICRQGKVVRNLYTKNRGRVHHGGDQLHVLLRNTTLTSTGYGFIASLLTYDPRKRMTSAQGLEHEWFKQDPLPIDKDILPTHPPTNNETRDSVMKRNKEKRSKALGFMQF